MIVRVFENASKASLVGRAIVATDDERIYKHSKEHKVDVVYTSPDCNNGSERVAEVAQKYDTPYIFEMQGDSFE